jgi:hypothetical protein
MTVPAERIVIGVDYGISFTSIAHLTSITLQVN